MFWFNQYRNFLYFFVLCTVLCFSLLHFYQIKNNLYTTITLLPLIFYFLFSITVLTIGSLNLFAPSNYSDYLVASKSYTSLNIHTLKKFLDFMVRQQPACFFYFMFQIATIILLLRDYIKIFIHLFIALLFHKPYTLLENKDLRDTILSIIFANIFFYGILYSILQAHK